MSNNNKKAYISKRYNIPYNNIKDNQLQYYYTTTPELCCKYKLKPISTTVQPYDFPAAMKFLNDYYKDIHCDYYKNLYNYAQKYGNSINSYPSDVADRIIFEYIRFREKTFCFVMWPMITEVIDNSKLKTFLKDYGHVYHIKKIRLNYTTALGIVYQLYSDTKRFGTIEKIKEKLKYLGWNEGEKKVIQVVFFENTSNEVISGSQAQLKTKIRNYLLSFINKEGIRGDDLVHVNDYFYQTIEYSQMFLHKESLKFLRLQQLEQHLSPKFDLSRLYINTIKNWITTNIEHIDYDRFLLFGSTILYVYGLRNCRDADGLVYGHNAPQKLIQQTGKDFWANKTKFYFASLGIMDTEYWNKEWDTKDTKWLNMMKVHHKDELLFDPQQHFYFNGMKFLVLKNEVIKKYIRNKPQDYADIFQVKTILNIKVKLPANPSSEFLDGVLVTLDKKYGDTTTTKANLIQND